jgi:hypothetical protein
VLTQETTCCEAMVAANKLPIARRGDAPQHT